MSRRHPEPLPCAHHGCPVTGTGDELLEHESQPHDQPTQDEERK